MKKIAFLLFTLVIVGGCTSKDRYDAAEYYDIKEQNALMTSITTYLYKAPDGVASKDRFSKEHNEFYSAIASKFHFYRFYKNQKGRLYFFIIRDTMDPSKRKRGVGGYFEMEKEFELYNFREVFVTPLLSEADVKTKGEFLFEELVKGDIEKYLNMNTYVEWPNVNSVYDTINYEWILKPKSN